MGPKRRDRRFLPFVGGVGVATLLEPRRLLSATVGPARLHLGRGAATARQPLVPASIDGVQIVALGPRPAGSAANAGQRQLVAQHFSHQGATVREQPFSAVDPRTGARVEMANLIGSWHPERTRRVLIGAHYDTRPYADEDPDPALRRTPYLGANDGASGVALLMEIANHLEGLPTAWGVDLVLFDGEELIDGGAGAYLLGSGEFARAYTEGLADHGASRYDAGLVVDMIGDADLAIDREPNSVHLAPRLVREVWSVARQVGATAFRDRRGRAVLDDHLPLNAAGIPAIDLIDFDYPAWHTTRDLPDQTSAASLAQVGRVVTAWLGRHRSA